MPTKLSDHFTLEELSRSDTALRLGLDNRPPAHVQASLILLCRKILEPIRANFGGPLTINSGYRSPEVNARVGSGPTSQHVKGEAADIESPHVSNYDLARWIAANLDFDQVILECYTPGQPSSGWVHVSHRATNNRKELLTAHRVNDKMTYTPGLLA